MDYFRFKLQKYTPGSKITCPSCGGKRCAVRYIDTEGIIEFPNEVCLCDHANSCGYHYPPRQYFADHPEIKEKYFGEGNILNKGTSSSVSKRNLGCGSLATEPQKCLPPSFVDPSMLSSSMGYYNVNPLFTFLSAKFGKEETERIFRLYNVGTSKRWGGATVFWRTDIHGNLRTGKVMGYDPKSGHRIKKPFDHVNWVHSMLKLPDFNMKLCLFGEHLLCLHPDKEVMLVEAEKTALIASHFMPHYLWLATGGLRICFDAETMSVLRGRKVVLFPDLGGYDEWTKRMDVLRPICNEVSLSGLLENIATEEQRKHGYDIADILLMEETNRDILNRMIERKPALQLLIDALQLELVED